MTLNRLIRGSAAIVVTAMLATALLGCGQSSSANGSSSTGSLSCTVVPREGGIVAKVVDERPGKHTIWIVLDNPPEGRHHELLAAIDYDRPEGDGVEVGGDAPLPPGTYSYAVYSVDDVVSSSGSKYWTSDHRVASGEVTVR